MSDDLRWHVSQTYGAFLHEGQVEPKLSWQTVISGFIQVQRSECGRFVVVCPPAPCKRALLWKMDELAKECQPLQWWFNTVAGAMAFAEDLAAMPD